MSRWSKLFVCLLAAGIMFLQVGAARAAMTVTVTGDAGIYANAGDTATVFFDAVVDGLPDTVAECTDEVTTWTWSGTTESYDNIAWVDYTVPFDAVPGNTFPVSASATATCTSSCGNAEASGSASTNVTVCACGK